MIACGAEAERRGQGFCMIPAADRAVLEGLYRRIAAARIPVNGSFELTLGCNLNCVHCYQKDERKAGLSRTLDAGQVFRLIDEMTSVGTLYLTLTGGEPLLHQDFEAVYCHAIQKGLLVTVLCNGTLISDEIATIFRDYPPRMVEISLNGATPETHEKVTRVKGAHEALWKGIQRLRDNRIRFSLKTVLSTLNCHELGAMEAQAAELGVRFRYDTMIFGAKTIPSQLMECGTPDGDGESISALRLTPEAIATIDGSSKEHQEPWRNNFKRFGRKCQGGDQLYVCGAGKTDFHITPAGILMPCILNDDIHFDLKAGTFREGWAIVSGYTQACTCGPDYPCNACVMRSVCAGCPAIFKRETGYSHVVPESICDTTRLRFNTLKL